MAKWQEFVVFHKSVLERDNYTCQMCGSTNKDLLIVHHILSRDAYPRLIAVVSNGLTVCKKCHNSIPQQSPCRPKMKYDNTAERSTEGYGLTVAQVADQFHISCSCLEKWLNRGAFPGFKVGDSWVLSSREIDRYVTYNMNYAKE